MKNSLVILFLLCILFSCTKDDAEKDRILNGVNVNVAVSTLNSFRTQGITDYPSVSAVRWNDTLSQAAYNFAKAKTEDVNTPSSAYDLSNGQMILNFPNMLNYSGRANFALFFGYPADADVINVINAGFATNNPFVLAQLMNPNAKRFGMGQYGGKWYLILSN